MIEEVREVEVQKLKIGMHEKLYLDGKEIPNILYYMIEHDAETDDDTATLTIKIPVIVDC